MKKLICALIGAAALVASATTYIQTSPTGTAPWKPVKDSVSLAHLADSARHAPPSAYADSSRASRLADSAKRVDTSWLSARYLPLTGGVLSGNLRMGSGGISTADGAFDVNRSTALGNALTVRTLNSVYPFFRINSYGSMYWGPGNSDADAAIERTAPGVLTITGSLSGSINGNAATATKLATARTLSMTGDGTWSTSFDGSANAAGALTLASVYTGQSAIGNAAYTLQLDLDTKGRVTDVSTVAISIPHTQINDWSTATSSFLTANQSITLTGAVTGSGTTSIATTFANTHLAGINQDLTTTSTPVFGGLAAGGTNFTINQPNWNYHIYILTGGINAIDAVTAGGTTATTSVTINGSLVAPVVYEAGVSLSSKYAPIAVSSYFSTNTARTLSSQSGSVYIYTVSQTTTQTLQNGTFSGEAITVKNAQNSSTLVLTGNINAGSSTIPSLSTAVLVWDGSKWY